MNTNILIRKLLVVILSLCLISPGTALAGGKSGKKNFREGQKYEAAQQWDLAAQQYALAIAAEPNNPEYKLHYIRALQQASIMYVKRGDALSEQSDFASAYTAYRTAYQYDPGNEIARIKMERMLDQQKAQINGGEPLNVTATGNVRPTSDIQFLSKSRNRDVVSNISFSKAKFKNVIGTLARQLDLNVVFDDQVKNDDVDIDLTNVTVAKAFDTILLMKKYTFEQIDRRTILIYSDNATNRPRYEKLMVKTFYPGNISGQQARQLVQQIIGGNRPMATLDGAAPAGGGSNNSNVLIVKATASELQLIQDILDSVDKNKNEVVLDVEIYEVSHDSLLQIGNQVATEGKSINQVEYVDKETGKPYYTSRVTSSLNGLGGFGSRDILPGVTNIGALVAGFSGVGAGGFLLGLPPTSLSFLQSKGNSKLLYKTQIHVLDGGQNTTKVGRSVPVRLGTSYGFGGFGNVGGGVNGIGGGINNGGINTGGNLGNGLLGGGGGFGYPGIDSIQYRDVGLVIETKPVITNEGYVEIQMKFETSDVLASGADSQLTPTFTQRSLNTTARIKDGVTSVVAGVNQESRGDSRAGIPVLGMVPILGRFFTAPRQESRQSDIVITVTPHIVRSAGINAKDHLAKDGGLQQGGLSPKIEEVIFRAQQEEEQERRLIAQQLPPTQTVPLTPDSQVATVPASAVPSNSAPVVNASNTNTGAPARAPRTLDNNALDNRRYNNAVPNSPEPVPFPTPPPQPQPDQPPTGEGDIAAKGTSDLGKEGKDGKDGKDAKDGKKDPADEFAGQVFKPEREVAPATVRSSQPSEAYLRKMAELKRSVQPSGGDLGKAIKPTSAPVEMPKELLPQQPQQKISQAAPTMTSGRGGNMAISLNLSPKPIKQQVGKSFTVAVEVNGQTQMTGANVALKFDAAKLQVKSVRDGGVLGAQPELNYDIQKGKLIVRIKNAQGAPVTANGQLIVIEFISLSEGQSELAFNSGDTKLTMAGNVSTAVSGTGTQVIISRDAVTSATHEK